jgi:hypothetical protein
MKTEVKIYNIKDIIKKTSVGELDLETSLHFARDTAGIAFLKKRNHILLDMRETTVHLTNGFQDVMKVATEFTNNLVDCENKFAALVPDNEHRLLIATQFKSCLAAKGINYEIFTEFEEAMEWLSDTKILLPLQK